jgi:hypothetical protein
MELTNIQISNIMSVLEKLAGSDIDSVRVKYRITKLVRELNPHFEDFNKARQEILDECAEKDEEGNYIVPEDEEGNKLEGRVSLKDTDEFNKKMGELSQEKVDVSLSTCLEIGGLEQSSVDLPIQDIMILEPILKEEA